VPLICFALLPRAAASVLHIALPPTVITWYSTDFHNLDRARVLDQLRGARTPPGNRAPPA
jgi:hypothetical protein